METYVDTAIWGMLEIPYQYRFSPRKTLAISVHPDLAVKINAPFGTSRETIRHFVRRRGGWIRRRWREFEQYLPQQPARRYISGESHRYLGRQYRLKVRQGDTDSVKCLRGCLWVITRTEALPERVKILLDGWYRSHAGVIFHERLQVCHEKTKRLGIASPALRIRLMSSRWGSYSEKGCITLNLKLIQAPKDCIDYVIIHELCHAKVKNHSQSFWRLLRRLMPDFEERRKKLNILGVEMA